MTQIPHVTNSDLAETYLMQGLSQMTLAFHLLGLPRSTELTLHVPGGKDYLEMMRRTSGRFAPYQTLADLTFREFKLLGVRITW